MKDRFWPKGAARRSYYKAAIHRQSNSPGARPACLVKSNWSQTPALAFFVRRSGRRGGAFPAAAAAAAAAADAIRAFAAPVLEPRRRAPPRCTSRPQRLAAALGSTAC